MTKELGRVGLLKGVGPWPSRAVWRGVGLRRYPLLPKTLRQRVSGAVLLRELDSTIAGSPLLSRFQWRSLYQSRAWLSYLL